MSAYAFVLTANCFNGSCPALGTSPCLLFVSLSCSRVRIEQVSEAGAALYFWFSYIAER